MQSRMISSVSGRWTRGATRPRGAHSRIPWVLSMTLLGMTGCVMGADGGADVLTELMAPESHEEARAILARVDAMLDAEAGSTRLALTSAQAAYFRDNLCFVIGEDFSGCYPGYELGNSYAAYDAKTSFFTVAPYRGNVSVTFQYQGNSRFTDAVFQGEVQSYWWQSATYAPLFGYSPWDYLRRRHHWRIIHANRDGFHWAFNFRWTCKNAECTGWLRR